MVNENDLQAFLGRGLRLTELAERINRETSMTTKQKLGPSFKCLGCSKVFYSSDRKTALVYGRYCPKCGGSDIDVYVERRRGRQR